MTRRGWNSTVLDSDFFFFFFSLDLGSMPVPVPDRALGPLFDRQIVLDGKKTEFLKIHSTHWSGEDGGRQRDKRTEGEGGGEAHPLPRRKVGGITLEPSRGIEEEEAGNLPVLSFPLSPPLSRYRGR